MWKNVRKRLLRSPSGYAVLLAVVVGGVLLAQNTPLTPIGQLRGRTDSTGALYVAGNAASGSQGPLTPIANLRGTTDSSGNLNVTIGAGSATPDTLCLDATNHDTCLARDAADTLAQRRSTNAQTWRLYNTYTDASNNEYLEAGWAGNVLTLTTAKNGAGSVRDMVVGPGSGGALFLRSALVNRWTVATTGAFQAVTDNSINIGATGAGRPAQLFLGAPSVTVGSGTGVTVNDTGSVREVTYKITVLSTQFIAAATTADFTILTLPANTWVTNVTSAINTTFACASTCTTSTLSIVLGKGAGGAEYLASLDADAATGIFGDADAELGTLLVRAAAIQGGTFTSGTQAMVMRLTSGTGNIGTGAATNLSQGSITFWVTTRVLQ